MMQAIVYSAADHEGITLKLRRPPKSISKKSLLCEVICVGLNPVDAKYLIGDKLPKCCASFGRRMVEGRTVGFDFAGKVVQVPAHCSFKAGDYVFGTVPPGVGTLSAYIVVPLHQISHKPASLSFSEAAALPLVGLTALQALKHDHRLSAGQHLLLIGASGGVGHVAVQVAKALGANVTAICSERNREFVSKLGADFVIDYLKGNEELIKCLHEAVQRFGQFDLCFDTVTSVEEKDLGWGYMDMLLPRNLVSGTESLVQCLLRGKYVTIGGPLRDWVRAGLTRVLGVNLFGVHDHFWVRFPHSSEALYELAALADDGRLRVHIDHETPMNLDAVRNDFARLHSRRVVGKCVVRIHPDPSYAAENADH